MKLSGDVEDKDLDLISPNVTPLEMGDLVVKISASLQIVDQKDLNRNLSIVISSTNGHLRISNFLRQI